MRAAFCSAALAIYYQLNTSGYIGLVIPFALWFVGTCVLMFVPQVDTPVSFPFSLLNHMEHVVPIAVPCQRQAQERH